MVNTEEEIYSALAQIAEGIFLNIDNKLLDACIKAAQQKVIEVCGALGECTRFEDDNIIGTDSLISYKNKDGDTVIDGLMNFGLLGVNISSSSTPNSSGEVTYNINKGKYGTLFTNNGDDATVGRIMATVNTVANKAKQTIDIIATDPTIDMCINGRSNKWRYSRTGQKDSSTDNISRFPHLLDSYAEMIFNSALDKAYLNYNTKYDELVAAALEDQNDDVKSGLCSAMASSEGAPTCTEYSATSMGNPLCSKYSAKGTQSLFGSSDAVGLQGKDGFDLRYVVKGADIAAKLQNAAGGNGRYISTDDQGNMVGMITMTSAYSPGTNICTLTTTTTMCEHMQAIITTNSDSCGTGGIISAGCGHFSLIGGTSNSSKSETYHGTLCSKYGSPITETKEIKM